MTISGLSPFSRTHPLMTPRLVLAARRKQHAGKKEVPRLIQKDVPEKIPYSQM
mgnify:CR=1 FL=1